MELLKPRIQEDNLLVRKQEIYCDLLYNLIMDYSGESNKSILKVYLKTSIEDLLSRFVHEIVNTITNEQSDKQIKQEILLKEKTKDALWYFAKTYILDYSSKKVEEDEEEDCEFDFEDSPEDQLRDATGLKLFTLIRGLEEIYAGC